MTLVRLIVIEPHSFVTHPVGKDWLPIAWACRTLWPISHLANIKSSRLCRTSPIALTLFLPLTDGHCHAHAHIINAHNCLIAPFSNASKQFLWVILPLNISLSVALCIVPIRVEESFSPLTEFIVPVPPPPLLRSKKKNQLKIDDNFVISRSVNFHGMSFKLVV